MIPAPPPDLWTLDAFVEAANAALPGVLPDAPVVRIERTVTPRLVRYLTTQGALSEPHKAGREARYDRRHLVELLAVRRLMALGHTVAAIGASVRTRSDAENEALLTGAVEIGAADTGVPPPSATPPESSRSMASPMDAWVSYDPPSMQESAADFLRSLDPSASSEIQVRAKRPPGPRALSAPPPVPSPPFPASPPPLPPGIKPSRRPGSFPERWHRAEVLPGVELHMRHDARLPSSPSERDALVRTLLAALDALARR